MGKSEVSTSVVKWSEGLSNRVSIIIRRYIDHMAVSFITFLHVLLFYLVSLYIWLYVLYVSVSFCKLSIFIVMLSILIFMYVPF